MIGEPWSRPRLLVSVRSAREAHEAIAGGCDILDVKEPSRGALGRPDADVISKVVEVASQAGRHMPVTAALGELCDPANSLPDVAQSLHKLSLFKAGLARMRGVCWSERFTKLERQCAHVAPLIPVAYADAVRAQSPSPAEVVAWAMDHQLPAVLVDTYVKDGRGLWEWLTPGSIADWTADCRANGVLLGVAGALRPIDLYRLQAPLPHVVAIRGAACRSGDRDAQVDRQRVRHVKTALGSMEAAVKFA